MMGQEVKNNYKIFVKYKQIQNILLRYLKSKSMIKNKEMFDN